MGSLITLPWWWLRKKVKAVTSGNIEVVISAPLLGQAGETIRRDLAGDVVAFVQQVASYGGLMSASVPAEATAFAYRDAPFATALGASYADPADDEANIAWSRDYAAALRPFCQPGGYKGFDMDEGPERVRANYRQHHARLISVKRRYDRTTCSVETRTSLPPETRHTLVTRPG
jgi:hypothetical protein